MITTGLVLTGVAALIHLCIFYMESFAWTSEKARATFGTSAEEARATRGMAFNQGFYNLFLALAVCTGIIGCAVGARPVGLTLVFTGAGSMAAAAVVLLLSSPDKRGAALKQGTFPLLGIIFLTVGLLL